MKHETETKAGEYGRKLLRFDGRRLCAFEHAPVREFPLSLHVNGVELATLISSPHDLHFLVAGFLRMQGLVERLEDLQVVSVCPDSGVAHVRIRGEVPGRLKPTLTSGCGSGISFHLPRPGASSPGKRSPEGENVRRTFPAEAVFAMMENLSRQAEKYREHGGIHSAAVGEGATLLLSAEDLGRHNTLDRIAGEALLKGIDLGGKILVTSGRVSSEMAAKGASLGVALIASRTSPTDLAVRICEEAGITLVGYVRGRRFTVYTHPERISAPSAQGKIEGVTGVILAGGTSSRMGSNKALLPYQGGRFIESIHRKVADLFEEVLVVTNTPELFDFLLCRKVPDLYPGMGSLAGIHAGLHHSKTGHIFVVGCDMPYLNGELVRYLASGKEGYDVVIPETGRGPEPLHAVYGKGALGAIEEALKTGDRKVVSFFGKVKVRKVAEPEVERFDPSLRSFRNINTPEDYFHFRESEKDGPLSKAGTPEDHERAGR